MRQIISGIYKITCIPTGKFYVGASCDINLRFYHHKRLLNQNNHFNQYLQTAWNEFGANAFIFDVVEVCKRTDLLNKEQYWLDTLRPYVRNLGFNISKKAELGDDRSRYWIVTHPDGHEEIVFSLTKFCRENDLSQGNMTEVAKGKRKQHLGYSCRAINTTRDEWVEMCGVPRKQGPGWKGYWEIKYPDGTTQKVFSLSKFCKQHGLSQAALSLTEKKRRNHHKGFSCQRVI